MEAQPLTHVVRALSGKGKLSSSSTRITSTSLLATSYLGWEQLGMLLVGLDKVTGLIFNFPEKISGKPLTLPPPPSSPSPHSGMWNIIYYTHRPMAVAGIWKLVTGFSKVRTLPYTHLHPPTTSHHITLANYNFLLSVITQYQVS